MALTTTVFVYCQLLKYALMGPDNVPCLLQVLLCTSVLLQSCVCTAHFKFLLLCIICSNMSCYCVLYVLIIATCLSLLQSIFYCPTPPSSTTSSPSINRFAPRATSSHSLNSNATNSTQHSSTNALDRLATNINSDSQTDLNKRLIDIYIPTNSKHS